MLRLLLLALIIFWIVRLWRRGARSSADRAQGQAVGTGEMVACAQCGTFVLRAEAMNSGGSLYCSERCRSNT